MDILENSDFTSQCFRSISADPRRGPIRGAVIHQQWMVAELHVLEPHSINGFLSPLFRSFIKRNGHALRSQPYHLGKSTIYRDLIPTSRKHEPRFCIVAINRWMAYYCCLPLVAHAVGETRIPTYAMAPYRSAKRAEESRNKRIEKLQGVRSSFIDRPQLAADLE